MLEHNSGTALLGHRGSAHSPLSTSSSEPLPTPEPAASNLIPSVDEEIEAAIANRPRISAKDLREARARAERHSRDAERQPNKLAAFLRKSIGGRRTSKSPAHNEAHGNPLHSAQRVVLPRGVELTEPRKLSRHALFAALITARTVVIDLRGTVTHALRSLQLARVRAHLLTLMRVRSLQMRRITMTTDYGCRSTCPSTRSSRRHCRKRSSAARLMKKCRSCAPSASSSISIPAPNLPQPLLPT